MALLIILNSAKQHPKLLWQQVLTKIRLQQPEFSFAQRQVLQ
jgi:hypothetical protein